jgi:hypothetical protein
MRRLARRKSVRKFSVRMRIEKLELLVIDSRKYVVEQKPNADAAIGGFEQAACKHEAGTVRLHQEVLSVDGLLG